MQQVRNTFKIKMPSSGVGMRMPPAQPNFPARIPSPTMPSMRAPYAELPVMRAMHRGGDIEKDGLYPLEAGERVIPRGAADARVKIKASGTDAMRVLAGETIPAGLRSRSVRKNAYYTDTGEVSEANHTPHDRKPVQNKGERGNPAFSVAQRKLMGLAEHNPSAVSAKNRGVLKMTHKQLHDFASTKDKGLPKHVKRGKKK
jgi:hypothetical protein